ncbi:uncharacterized protein VTP21DRAFT_9123 [Calcarisporiella thermophila]|uniref:uncharacterized protein n=1 Tax=Calcarisporiella thermophila TaxID=911321 RepID=UPI003744717D
MLKGLRPPQTLPIVSADFTTGKGRLERINKKIAFNPKEIKNYIKRINLRKKTKRYSNKSSPWRIDSRLLLV